MDMFEKIGWSLGAVFAAALALYTLTLPEDQARRAWGGNDPSWCVPIGVALLIGALVWIWLKVWREDR